MFKEKGVDQANSVKFEDAMTKNRLSQKNKLFHELEFITKR